jgi:hypothetical protein
MDLYCKQVILTVLLVLFAAACTATSTAAPMQTSTIPVQLPSTSSPTTQTLMPTALSATTANPPPITTLLPTGEVETETNQDDSNGMEANNMNINIGDVVLTATLVENSSVDALKEALSEGPITVNMRDYGSMEKVGSLGMDLPRNDEQITTEAGDIILYQGSAIVIYYAPNSWNFTRLGKIHNVSTEELREILGDGNVTITLSLPQE